MGCWKFFRLANFTKLLFLSFTIKILILVKWDGPRNFQHSFVRIVKLIQRKRKGNKKKTRNNSPFGILPLISVCFFQVFQHWPSLLEAFLFVCQSDEVDSTKKTFFSHQQPSIQQKHHFDKRKSEELQTKS